MSDEIKMEATLDNSDYIKRINEIQRSLEGLSRSVAEQNATLGNAFDSVKTKGFEFLSMLGIATGLKSFASQVATVRGEFQQLESAFTTLLGNEDKAMSLMSQLTRTAAITPFGLQDVANSAKQLLAYGTAADDVNDKILQLGNIASGMGLNMGYMSMLYGTTASKDFMDTMDLKQHKGQGIPIEEAIANVMGIQKKEVAQAVTNRQVSSDVYQKAIAQLAGDGGKFDGMMEAQSKTITGQISNIEDAVSVMFNNIGKDTEGVIHDVLAGATWVVENYKQVAEAIGAVAGAYGMYKAALAATTAIQHASAQSEIEALQQLIGVQEEAYGDKHLADLVRKGQLTSEEASQLEQLRGKVSAMQKQYEEEVTSLQSRADELDKNITLQKDYVTAKQKEVTAFKTAAAKQKAAGNMREAVALELEAERVQADLNTKSQALNKLETERAANAKALNAASTRASSLSMAQDTLATNANNKAKQMASILGAQVTKVFQALKAAVVTNPIGAMAAAVTALGYAIYKIVTYKTDWEEAQEAINESMSKGAASAAGEIVKLRGLCDRLGEAKKSLDDAKDAQDKHNKKAEDATDSLNKEGDATLSVNDAQMEYNRVKNEIISQFGDYHKGLEDEKKLLDDTNLLYTTLSSNIMTYHMSKAKSEAQSKAIETYQNSVGGAYSDADKKIQKLKGTALAEAKEKLSAGKINDTEYATIEKQWEQAEKEIKNAIMNGSLSYDIRSKNLYSEATRVNADGSKEIYNGISAATNNLLKYETEASVDWSSPATIVQGNHLQEVAQKVGNKAKILQAELDEIDRKYNDAFMRNKVDNEDNQGTQTEDPNSHYLEELTKKIEAADAEVQKAYKDVKAGKKYTPAGSSKAVAMDGDYVKAFQDKLDKLLKDWKNATGEDYYAGKNKVKSSKGAGVKTIDTQAAGKELQALLRQQAEEQRKAGEEAQKQARAQMLQQEQDEINLMQDGVQKRLRQRELNNKKEVLAIYEEAEQRKEAIVAAAKDEFEKQEAINEKRANSQGRKYTKKVFDREAYVNSQIDEEGFGERSEFYIVDEQAAQKYATLMQAQEKARQDNYAKDLKEYEEYWTKIAGIYTAYAQQLTEIDKQEKEKRLTSEEAEQQKQVAEQNFQSKLNSEGVSDQLLATQQGDMIADMSGFVNEIMGASIDQLKAMLDEALTALDAMTESEKAQNPETVAMLRAKLNAANAQIKQLKAKNPDQGVNNKVLKSWKNWRGVIEQSCETLADLGDLMGGTVGEAFKAASEIGSSVIGIIDNIGLLAQTSMHTTQTTAEGTSKAVQAAERASVILAIIQAAMKVVSILDGFLNKDKSREEWEDAVAKQQEINKMTDAVNDYRTAVMKARQEEAGWFGTTGFTDIKNSVESAQDALTKYNEKLNQQQVKYQNEKGGKSFFGRMASVVAATGGAGVGGFLSWKKGNESNADTSLVSAVDNLRFETRSAKKGGIFKKGRDQQTVDLRTWAKQTYGSDLFGADGMIDVEMAQNIIDNYGDKLVGETKATLEALVAEAEAYNEAMDSLKETVADWYSPIVDNMTDALFNWLDTGEDVLSTFKDSASETFRDIANEMVKTMIQKTIFDGFEDDIKGYAEEYGKGNISMEEMFKKSAARTKDAMDTAEEMMPYLQDYITQVNESLEESGLTIKETDTDQSATYGGYETMSEETGTELSGRFSAMYIVQSEQLALAKGMNEKIMTGVTLLSSSYGALCDLRNLQATNNQLASSIANTVGKMYANWNERIENIEKYTKNLD